MAAILLKIHMRKNNLRSEVETVIHFPLPKCIFSSVVFSLEDLFVHSTHFTGASSKSVIFLGTEDTSLKKKQAIFHIHRAYVLVELVKKETLKPKINK